MDSNRPGRLTPAERTNVRVTMKQVIARIRDDIREVVRGAGPITCNHLGSPVTITRLNDSSVRVATDNQSILGELRRNRHLSSTVLVLVLRDTQEHSTGR